MRKITIMIPVKSTEMIFNFSFKNAKAEAAVSDLKRQDCTRSDIRRKTTKGLSFQTTPFHSMEKNKWQIS